MFWVLFVVEIKGEILEPLLRNVGLIFCEISEFSDQFVILFFRFQNENLK